MIYVDFRSESVKKIKEKYKDWQTTLFRKGDTSDKKKDLLFIHDTNKKYFGNMADTIGGDFIRLERCYQGENSLVCRFEVKNLYDEFIEKGWDQIWKIIDMNTQEADDSEDIINSIRDYEKINNRIIARPLNYEENKDKLEGMVYRKIGDFVIALYLRISEKNNDLVSTKIHKSIFDSWGITEDEAIDKALENSSILYPPRIFKVVADMYEDTIGIIYLPVDMGKDSTTDNTDAVCMCPDCPNGAAAFFYPGMSEKIAKLFGGEDYYVVFTAISEFHLHRCKYCDPEIIKDNLRASNERFPVGVLSNEIFKYDVEGKRLVTV